jgi:hypothetical protein
MPDAMSAGLTGYRTLLAAYRAEVDGSDEALTVAQNIAERLLADDVFGQLAALRRRLHGIVSAPMMLADTMSMWLEIDQAVKVLDAIAGEA